MEVKEGSDLALQDDAVEFVIVEAIDAVLLVGGPDAAGDGGRHASVAFAVAAVRQQHSLLVQQPATQSLLISLRSTSEKGEITHRVPRIEPVFTCPST